MAYLPNDLTALTTVSNTAIQQNDAALDNAISGNLTEANFSSATRIPNSILASPNVEEIVTFEYGPVSAGAIMPLGTLEILRIPGTATYTVAGASYAFLAITGGGTTGSVSIQAGSITGSVFVASSTLVNAVALPNIASAQAAAGDFTIATTTFASPTVLALNVTSAGVTNSIRLKVTLRLTRSLQ